VNPSGKLPITYPRSTNRLFTYDHKFFSGSDTPEGRDLATPQFEFGSGLSYTTFAYSDLDVNPIKTSRELRIEVDVNLKNTGNREGKEVVQLYLSKRFASITPPLKRLKRFAKIDLKPGEERRLSFELTQNDLSFIGLDKQPVVEPGTFDLSVAGLTRSFEWK
jgi:beta-glucosidase